jgi:hypothetical protein
LNTLSLHDALPISYLTPPQEKSYFITLNANF